MKSPRLAFARLLMGSALALAVTGCGVNTSGMAATLPSPAAPPVQSAPTAPAAKPLNVLMIISDDLNTRIGTYGAPVSTPNIDALANGGVRFDRAYAQFPWCAPSRASFMTGLRPDTVGVTDLRTHVRAHRPDLVTLPQHFRSNGYFAGRVGKVFHQGVPGGIGKPGADDPMSWDQVIDPKGRDTQVEDRLINRTPGVGLGSALAYLADQGPDEAQTDGMVATDAIRMIQENKDKPFFIAAGFYRPHVPLIAPEKYFDLYQTADMQIAPETPNVLPASRAWLPDHFGLSADAQREVIRAYYASTSYMDAQVGRILAALDEAGLRDNTIVIFLSDHGFLLGEHGQWMKNVLWDQSVRVPLIIQAPGMAGNGAASPRTVELIDIFPTITALAGLPPVAVNQGTSLVPLLQRPNATWDKPAFSQVQGGRSVQTDRWRYTEWEAGKKGRELYDHHTDAGERSNLVNDPHYAALVEQLSGMLSKQVEARTPALRYEPDQRCLALPEHVSSSVGTRCQMLSDP